MYVWGISLVPLSNPPYLEFSAYPAFFFHQGAFRVAMSQRRRVSSNLCPKIEKP